jgi:tetratricopeptide (TPR) repeat protein
MVQTKEMTIPEGRPPSRPRRWLASTLAVAVLASAAGAAVRLFPGHAGLRGAGAYPYPFQRAPRGSVRAALEREVAFYQDRLRHDPRGGLDQAALGRAYLKMARATGDLAWYLLAEQAARRSLASLPFHNDGAVLVLARVAEARHDFPEALRLASQLAGTEEALAIRVTVGLARGQTGEAAAAAAALVRMAPTLGSQTLQALVLIATGDDAGALRAFDRALASEEPGEAGTSAWARALLGRFHARRGRLTLARALDREALAILPQYPPALLGLAELEARAGEYDAAAAHLSDIVTVTATSPNVYDHAVLRGLGRIRWLQGDVPGARALWDQAEARLRRDVAAGAFGHRRELARLLLDRGRPQDLPEALALMHTEAAGRRDPETLETLAWALSRAGRWLEAREAVREALRSGVRDAALFYRAGLVEQALGHPQEARRYLEAARVTDPTFDARARLVRGVGW